MYRGIHRLDKLMDVTLVVPECCTLQQLIQLLGDVKAPPAPTGFEKHLTAEPLVIIIDDVIEGIHCGEGNGIITVGFRFTETDENFAIRKQLNDEYWDKREGK